MAYKSFSMFKYITHNNLNHFDLWKGAVLSMTTWPESSKLTKWQNAPSRSNKKESPKSTPALKTLSNSFIISLPHIEDGQTHINRISKLEPKSMTSPHKSTFTTIVLPNAKDFHKIYHAKLVKKVSKLRKMKEGFTSSEEK